MTAISWNNIIWQAIEKLKNVFESRISKSSDIDSVFKTCEKELFKLKTPVREIDLRLFALALYCDKVYNYHFFKSAAFSRFSEALNFSCFEHTAKRLIKENNPAMIVFWVILRLSFVNSVPQSTYLPLEKKMKYKSLSLLY